MVDFQSGLWYSEELDSLCMWYAERPNLDSLVQQALFSDRPFNKWCTGPSGSAEDDRLVVNFLLTSWA